jgi:hypothetical protein
MIMRNQRSGARLIIVVVALTLLSILQQQSYRKVVPLH